MIRNSIYNHPVVREYRNRNRDRHGHFFDDDTMRFFGSRLLGVCEVVGDYGTGMFVFVTSEHNFHRTRRLYTVRTMDRFGTIEKVGGFQAYASRSSAVRAARKHAESLRFLDAASVTQ